MGRDKLNLPLTQTIYSSFSVSTAELLIKIKTYNIALLDFRKLHAIPNSRKQSQKFKYNRRL